MDPEASFTPARTIVPGSGGVYPSPSALSPPTMLANVFDLVPELASLGAALDLEVVLNTDSCRVTPGDWATIARVIDGARPDYDAFIVICGTDTLAYVATALSYMLRGFGKALVITGSQRPLGEPRTDARQNLVDAVSVAVAGKGLLREVVVCFGGLVLRGNRTQKTHASAYAAFDSPTYPALARLGVDVAFNAAVLWEGGAYEPRFEMCGDVMRVPVVPGLDPYVGYGDVAARGVRGVVLEVFGVGNCDDREDAGWIPWLREMREKGVEFFLTSQCSRGRLQPESYRSGSAAMLLGAESSKLLTAEAATVKLMFCLANRDVKLNENIAGEI